MIQMVNKSNNSSNPLVFGLWSQTKMANVLLQNFRCLYLPPSSIRFNSS